jgi:alpha-beta hydrolase superfamily lysophospholipase
MRSFFRHALLFVVYGTLGVIVTLITVYVTLQQRRPDLQAWHQPTLDAEYSASRDSAVQTLEDYLALEAALFDQLNERVYARTPTEQQREYIRFATGSLADPTYQTPNWNRTHARRHPDARGAALLLHGLSDSPYSLRHLSDLLYSRGYSVLSLRLPGHGTAPSGLLDIQYEDWASTVRIAMRHIDSQVNDDQPIVIAGYSTGAALAVEYAAARLLGEDIPEADQIILFSPAIGVSPIAALAVWQARLASLPGMRKLAWTDILPEYDPYKYNSFTVNAGDQVYRLTQTIATQLEQLSEEKGVPGMPPILAFQSVADATVSTHAVLDALFLRLAPEGHELVAFDINRQADVTPLLSHAVTDARANLLDAPPMPMDFTLVVNAHQETDEMIALRRPAGSTNTESLPLNLTWPSNLYSLSHGALPFSSDDPIYGAQPQPGNDLIFLGAVNLRGERGLLSVSPAMLARLRHNPFMPYVDQRIIEFLK